MKKLFLLIALTSTVSGWTQGYTTFESTGTTGPYSVRKGVEIAQTSLNDELSDIQNIPFDWTFYGASVSEYRISDNGYITFELTATDSEPDNTPLPNVNAPGSAIFAYWDELQFTNNAAIRITNYGSSPNRVHVIQWYGLESSATSEDFYFAIRLYECGDFDIIHNHGTAISGSATVGVQDAPGGAATMYAGPDYGMAISGSGSNSTNDRVFSFVQNNITRDLRIDNINGANNVLPGIYTISGTILNRGVSDINSMDIHYAAGGGVQTMSLTGLNIPAGIGTYDFTHNIDLNIGTPGTLYDLSVWADNPNGFLLDDRTCNDLLNKKVMSITGTSATTKGLVLEKFSGAWCGNCPNAALTIAQLANDYEEVHALTVHTGDLMEFDDGIREAFGVLGVPAVMADRTLFADENFEVFNASNAIQHVEERLMAYSPVDVSVEASFNPVSREISGTITADFADYMVGDLNFMLFVREDSVVGMGTGYDQSSYYNGTPGHPLEGLGNPIIGYNHNYVLRALPFGPFGLAGAMPEVVNQGDLFTQSFSYTLPEAFDETKIKVIGAVAQSGGAAGEREILNSGITELTQLVDIENADLSDNKLLVYPNPAKELVHISWSDFSVAHQLEVLDVSGKVLFSLNKSTLAGQSIHIPTQHIGKGIFLIVVNTDKGQLVEKLVIH